MSLSSWVQKLTENPFDGKSVENCLVFIREIDDIDLRNATLMKLTQTMLDSGSFDCFAFAAELASQKVISVEAKKFLDNLLKTLELRRTQVPSEFNQPSAVTTVKNSAPKAKTIMSLMNICEKHDLIKPKRWLMAFQDSPLGWIFFLNYLYVNRYLSKDLIHEELKGIAVDARLVSVVREIFNDPAFQYLEPGL